MANSSFFKNTGTSTQIQGSANASAAAALASEQAALVSKNAAATSETNSAASAAAALVSKNAAATSAASANSDASAASSSATAAQTAATSSSANAASTSADATQTAADRVQTGLDRVATAADAVQTAADRVQTGLDVTSSSASAAAALSSRNAAATSETNAAASAASSSADATATASDRVQTGLDAASTAADAIATAADRVQTGLDATASATSASAASTSATAAAASQVSAASSAASAAAVFNDFEDRYYGPHASDSAAQTHVTGLGLTVDQGDLYFNSTANEMRVYDGGSWIAASSAGGASLINYNYTATASQTAFTGADDNSNTLSYTVDNLIVTRNGVVLEDGTDYTATDGSTITLTVAAAAGDEINVVAFKSFTTADMVSATNGGTFQSNVTVNGTMTATAFSGDGSALTGIPTPTLTSLGIANHDDITVDGSGNVGIGVSSMTNKLVLPNAAYFAMQDTGGAESLAIRANSSNAMEFLTGGGVKATIDTSGNVGIGKSPVSAMLDVNGNVKAGNGTASAPAYSFQGSSAIGMYTPDSGFSVAFGTGGSERLRIDASGNAFMKTANSYIAGTTSLGFYGDAASSNGMRIDSAGRISINTAAATELLNVAASAGNGAGVEFAGNGTTVGSTSAFYGQGSGSDAYVWNRANNPILFGTNNAEVVRVQTGGLTLSPAANNLYTTSGTLSYYGTTNNVYLNGASSGGMIMSGNGNRNQYVYLNSVSDSVSITTNTLQRLVIDSSGRVTMPYQPAFSFIGVNNTWATTNNFQTLTPTSTKINRGNHYNGNTGVFTAPVSGVYFFGFWGLVYLNSGQLINWRYSLNGGYGSQLVQSTGSTGGHTNTSGSVILSLSANDTVTLDAGLGNQTAATPYYTQWNMYGYLMF